MKLALLHRALLALLVGAVACQDSGTSEETATNQVPLPELSTMEIQVANRLRELASEIKAQPTSAEAWGRFGMVAHAHELLDEAEIAYRNARDLDPNDERWPYFLGDVLSILGTDLESAEKSFRSFMQLHPDYAPAHMRLGNVLISRNNPGEAAQNLQRALDLEPALQPARVALAQVRLASGELDSAANLLETVLNKSPRHGQALSTLGQVYMRQGRTDQARKIATRARDAASYNLFADPLMGQVVAEGLSSIQIWERAKSFLENGNNEQAVIGLNKVIELSPSNAEAHLQLAVAYGNLGEISKVGHYLQRAVELNPESVDSRVRLASLYLDQQETTAAIPHLEAAVRLTPDDPDAGWLLGRALMQTAQLAPAISTFETTAALGVLTTASAHNDWGNALAQSGVLEAAVTHFEAALAIDPVNPQAFFFLGLAAEGRGRIEAAVGYYCRSLKSAPGSPAAARISALDRSCS